MIRSGESLEWVVENLMNGKKITGSNDENLGLAANSGVNTSKRNASPKRSPRGMIDARKQRISMMTSKNSSGIFNNSRWK